MFRRSFPLLFIGLILLVGCDSFEKDEAALQIRAEFCEGWPYGCTDSTEVVIGDVRETRHGRQVEFRVVDREDETATLEAAYFEQQGDVWDFMLFEPPFSEDYSRQKSRVLDDQRLFDEQLTDLKKAQRWFSTIYGRFAGSLAELDSVSYKPPESGIEMTVTAGGSIWRAEISSRYARCVLEVPRQQLPVCEGLPAPDVGTRDGPLSRAFGKRR